MPSSENYVRDYKQEAKTDRERGGIKKRALRNKARRMLMRMGLVRKGDGKDVDHIKPLSKGGRSTPGNLRAIAASKNRSYKRTSSGAIK